MRGQSLALLLICSLLTSCGLQGGIAGQATARADELTPAPPLSGTSLSGQTLTIATAAGHIVVVDFWASWCGPCRAEQPELNSLAQRYGTKGVVFIGVDMRDDPASGRAFVSDFHVAYPSLSDPSEQLASAWSVDAPPTIFVVDKSGRIRVRDLGTLVDVAPEIERLLHGAN